MLGGDDKSIDQASYLIIHQFLKQLTGNGNGIIYKHDFIRTIMQNKELLAIISPFYGRTSTCRMMCLSIDTRITCEEKTVN
jgi:hypothetical protein